MRADRIISPLAGVLLACSLAHASWAQQTHLLELVPQDAGVVIVCDDLREQTEDILASPVARRIEQQPAVQTWLKSRNLQSLRAVRQEIEATSKIRFASVWDEILGDSVVLAMVAGPEQAVEDVRGLFLARIRDRNVLDVVIAQINAAEIQARTLQSVDEVGTKTRIPYWHRRFRPGTKPDEWYAIIDEHVFAWSNSESEIQAVIRRWGEIAAPHPGESRFRFMANALPGRALIKLFVDPRFVERLWTAQDGVMGDDDPLARFLKRQLGKTQDFAAALEWKEGFILHLHERLDRPRPGVATMDRFPPASPPAEIRQSVPESALLLVSAELDVAWLIETFRELVPEAERFRFDSALRALGGMCYGKNVVKEIAPRLGPRAMAFLIPSTTPQRLFDFVGVIHMDPEAKLQEALQNGVETLFSLVVLDRSATRREVKIAEDSGTTITTLEQEARSWSVAVRPDQIVVSSSTPALSSWTKNNTEPSKSRLLADRRTYAPDAPTFGMLDCQALAKLAGTHRERLIKRWSQDQGRPEAEVANDVDKAIQLLSLFQVGFATSSQNVEPFSAHQTLGLIFVNGSKP